MPPNSAHDISLRQCLLALIVLLLSAYCRCNAKSSGPARSSAVSTAITHLQHVKVTEQLVKYLARMPHHLTDRLERGRVQSAFRLDLRSLVISAMLCLQALPHQGSTLMKAKWPAYTADAADNSALGQFDSLKELVRGVRNARTEYGLEQARKVCVWTHWGHAWTLQGTSVNIICRGTLPGCPADDQHSSKPQMQHVLPCGFRSSSVHFCSLLDPMQKMSAARWPTLELHHILFLNTMNLTTSYHRHNPRCRRTLILNHL